MRHTSLHRAALLLAAGLAVAAPALAQSETAEVDRSPRELSVPLTDDVRGKLEDLARAAAAEPPQALAIAQYGAALARVGRVDEGLAELTRAATLAPSEPKVQLLYARGLWKARQLEPAVDAARRVVDSPLATRREASEACRVGASTLWELNRAGDADAMFRRGLELDPTNGALHSTYGTFLAGQRRTADAVRHLVQVPVVSDDPRVIASAAKVLAGLGRHDDALPLWERAADLRPEEGDLNFRAAGEDFRARRWEKVVHYGTRALAANPQDGNAALIVSQALLRLGRFDEARQHATRAGELGAQGAGATLEAIRLEEGQKKP